VGADATPAPAEAQLDLSVILPAYNEATRLPDTLRRVAEYLAGSRLRSELIVVDDGSTDGTAAAVDEASAAGLPLRLMRHPQNTGKGAAVRTGVLASSGRVVLYSDADLSTPIEDLERLLAAIEKGADVAIGSRALDRKLVLLHQPWYRELMGRSYNLMVQAVLLRGLWDTQCGFKAYRGAVAHALFGELVTDRFGFDVEILYRARRHHWKIAEVPVHWRNSPGSRVSPLRDSADMFLGLFRIRRLVR
jgi:dolichyl-phosphate beta-glucosyltransferase